LWLMTKNKILTGDNLLKRKRLDDITCLFCTEPESVRHLLFDCCVAQSIWGSISEMLGFHVGKDFESIAKLWLNDKKYKYVNILNNVVVLWSLWKTRNNMCFPVPVDGDAEDPAMCAHSLRSWCLLLQEPGVLEQWADELEARSVKPLRVTWTGDQQRESVARSAGREDASEQDDNPGGCVRPSVLYVGNVVMPGPQDGMLL
jgi:hypothetical protein